VVTQSTPATVYTKAGHYHEHSSVATGPHQASVYIRNQQDQSTTVTESNSAVGYTKTDHYHDRSSMVTKPDSAVVYTRTDVYQDSSNGVTEPDQASTYIRNQHDHSTTVTDAKPGPSPNDHNQLQLTSNSIPPSSVENTVVEDIEAYAR